MQSLKLTLCCMVLLFSVACSVQPFIKTQSISATSIDNTVKAVTRAARETNWVIKTIDKENGYIYAERETSAINNSAKPYIYKLQINIENKLPSGKIELNVTVTPPPGIMGGEKPEDMVTTFLEAVSRNSGQN